MLNRKIKYIVIVFCLILIIDCFTTNLTNTYATEEDDFNSQIEDTINNFDYSVLDKLINSLTTKSKNIFGDSIDNCISVCYHNYTIVYRRCTVLAEPNKNAAAACGARPAAVADCGGAHRCRAPISAARYPHGNLPYVRL